jgi:hypothetical protein
MASALQNGFNANRPGDSPGTKQLRRVCSTKKRTHIMPTIPIIVKFFFRIR